MSINTQWPKLHRSKAKHNTTQHNSKLHHGWSPIRQYHLIQNHHHHHRPNRISLPQRTTTTIAAAAANPTTSRLYPVYPFTPSSSSSSSTPSKHRLSSLPSFTSNSKPIAASAWAQSRSPQATWTFGRRWWWPTTRQRLICCAFFGLQLWDSKKNFVALISVWVLWKWRKRERNWILSIVYFVC